MNSRGAKDLLYVHPFHCLYGCHSERLAIDEALHTVAVFQCFLCLCEGIFWLVFGKWYKTTRVALRKALDCLACHPRVHQAVSVRHTFKGDLGLLREQCYLRFYTSKYRQLFFSDFFVSVKEFWDLCWGNVAKRQESRWEKLSNASLVIHAFIRSWTLGRAVLYAPLYF